MARARSASAVELPMIVRSPVVSSNISSVGYDAPSLTLEIEFHSGKVYQYFDVPEQVYGEFVGAASLGSYFNAQIKNVYRCVQL